LAVSKRSGRSGPTRINGGSERNHALAAAKTFFTWAHKKRYITDNPTTGLTLHTRPPRSRVLAGHELKAIWKAADVIEGHFGSILKLLILTGQRRGEIAALQAAWIKESMITLPAGLVKNGREHTFPIGKTARTIITAALPSSSDDGAPDYLFPARGKPNHPFSGWSKGKDILDTLSCVTGWTLHDLRRTVATNLAELGVAPHVVEKLLNHTSGTISGVAAIYNKFQYLDEMREAVRMWERRVQSLLAA
jgi:integrase